jgi:hypothetical protein
MNKSPLPTILLAVLAVSAIASVVLCWNYISNTRQIRMLNLTAAQINNNRALLNALATDALEYSKRNPAINPLLESIGAKAPAGGAAATTAPKR